MVDHLSHHSIACDTLLEECDVIVGIGASEDLRKLERMVESWEALAT